MQGAPRSLAHVQEEVAVLHPVDADGFVPWLDAAVEIYTAAMNAPRAQTSGRRSIMERHLRNPGFRAYLALRSDTLVGMCYGFHGEPGQWWHDAVYRGLARCAGTDTTIRWLGDCFEVAELQVLPRHQKRGTGRRLITTLCAERTERKVVLSTHDTSSPARRLYRSLGFVDLLTRFRFPAGGEEFAVMGAPLPLPGSERPTGQAGSDSASRSRW